MPQPEPDDELRSILKILTGMKDGPYVMKVSAHTLSRPKGLPDHLNEYSLCSACFSTIEKTWDHQDWCELYKAEPLSDWLKKGKNEK